MINDNDFVYDSCVHETTIGHSYSLKVLDYGNNEVPILLKSWYPFRNTENPFYRDNTDNTFLRLDFIFDNKEDSDTFYNLLKKGTLKRVHRLTGRFKESEATFFRDDLPTWRLPKGQTEGKMEMTLEKYPYLRIVFPDHVKGSYKS